MFVILGPRLKQKEPWISLEIFDLIEQRDHYSYQSKNKRHVCL